MRAAAPRPRRLPGRRSRRCESRPRRSATTRPRRLPPAAAGRLRPSTLPDPDRRHRLPLGHAAEGVGEARAAPRRRREARFLARLSREIARRGALDVLRNGVKDSGCKFRLAYFRPASGLNEELQRLHAANLFAVVRQLRFSEQTSRASTSRSSSTASPSSPPSSRTPSTARTCGTPSGSTARTATPASRSSPGPAASPTSPSTPSRCS